MKKSFLAGIATGAGALVSAGCSSSSASAPPEVSFTGLRPEKVKTFPAAVDRFD